MKHLLFALSILFSPMAMAGTNGLDTNFGSGGALLIGPTPQSNIVFTRITAIKTLPDMKTLIGGRAIGDAAHPQALLAAVGRLNADGSWDTDFGNHGAFVLPYGNSAAPLGGEIHHVVLTGEGSIVAVGGAFKDIVYTGMHTCTLVAKLASDGTLSSNFGGTGDGAFCFDFAPDTHNGTVKGHLEDVSLEPDDGFLITTGYTNMANGAVARFLANGTLDPQYGNAGVIDLTFLGWLLARQTDGKTLVVGSPDSIYVQRLNEDGSTDTGYGNSGVLAFDVYTNGTYTNPLSARLDTQERLIITNLDVGPGYYVPDQIGLVDTNGQLDPDFNGAQQQPGIPGFVSLPISGNSTSDALTDSFPIPTGRTLALGYGNGTSDARNPYYIIVTRLNADASFDMSFGDVEHPGWAAITIGSSSIGTGERASAQDSVGHVLVSTEVTDDNSKSCTALLRFTPDRLFDSAFDATAALACPN